MRNINFELKILVGNPEF